MGSFVNSFQKESDDDTALKKNGYRGLVAGALMVVSVGTLSLPNKNATHL